MARSIYKCTKLDYGTELIFKGIQIQKSSETELIRKVYSGKYANFFEELTSSDLDNTNLQTTYYEEVNENLKLTEGHYYFFTGLWIPLKNSTLGIHPELGFQLGVKKSKWNYDLTVLFRFLKSKSEYLVYREESNQFEFTDHFFGGYFGLECGYDILTNKSNEIQLFTGLGADGFDTLKSRGEINGVSTFTYNFNFGLKYRKYMDTNKYYGLGVRYNVVDYTVGNKVDFNEFPISINFTYGFVGNVIKNHNLDQINYDLRK